MNLRSIRLALAAIFLMIAPSAFAADTLPAPVNGITFEEWAAGNARLSNNQPIADMLKLLDVDETAWNAANAAFLEELRKGDPAGYMYRRYAEVFADPAVGRFKNLKDTPNVKDKLATFEDYAKVQAYLSVGSRAGEDPAEILKEHDLTVYEFSQETKPWIQAMARAAGSDKMEEMNAILQHYTKVYEAKYGLRPE